MRLRKRCPFVVLLAALLMYASTMSAQVTIGSGEEPHASALLDLQEKSDGTSSKGFLGPRVALASPTDQTTILNPAVGLLVYNTGTGALKTIGYLYWNGEEWVQFTTGTTKAPVISNLDCINARIVPSRYKVNENYEGVLIVPYSGGNGGYYSSGTPILSSGVTGLTATLQPGNLAYGNGELIFTLSGTPSASSPALASFEITFAGQTCTAIVGSNSLTQGEIVFWHGSLPASASNVLASQYNEMPVIEDIFRLDGYFNAASNTEAPYPFIPRIYNASTENVKFWWGGVTSVEGRGRSNVVLAPNGYQNLDNGMYMGLGQNMRLGSSTPATSLDYGTTSQETMTIDVFYNGKWYRVFFTGWVDNMDTTATSDDVREIYITYQRMY